MGAIGRPVYARVAPPLPVPGLFTYLVPVRLVDSVVPGVRVSVPFGGRRLTAMVVEVGDFPPPRGVMARPLLALLEEAPLIGADILALGQWVSQETGCSVGEALDASLPRAVKRGHAGRKVEEARVAIDERVVAGVVEALQEKHDKQARALRILADRGGRMPTRELMNLAHVSRSPIASLAKAGHITLEKVVQSNDPLLRETVERTANLALTADQTSVRNRIVEVGDTRPADGHTFLLYGVTGSGKTEVYLQVLEHVVRSGRQGIVLVPEISLTPQTVKRFRERFDRVAVLHSHLTDAERNDQWRRIRRGEADVVIGARSAVFAPVPDLGLVILDEEHETSFKQQNVPRYHAREVAVERTRLTGGVTLLGTATPSLEAWHRASVGEYERLDLPERVAGGRTPEVVMVDLTLEQRRKSFSYLSDPLRAAMEDAFAREGQVILFLNRRGWATVLLCRTCRSGLKCPDCDVSMTLHRRIERVMCHYCGHEQEPPAVCPVCRSRLTQLGFGTEKIEEEVRRAFPGVSVGRMDSDTMSGRGAHAEVLSAFGDGRLSVLVGTQMIAKGLDFPNAVVVGVICADSALFLPDYRAAERTFQLLAQVTGRTGRGPKGGRVVVQAYDTRHPSIRMGMVQDYEGFARGELPDREALGYPPYGRLVRIVVQGEDFAAVRERIVEVGDLLSKDEEPGGGSVSGKSPKKTKAAPLLKAPESPGLFDAFDIAAAASPEGVEDVVVESEPDSETVEAEAAPVVSMVDLNRTGAISLLGPAPAPIPRINRQHRMHMVAKCVTDAAVDAVLSRLAGRTAPAKGVRVMVDADPVSML
ncbi:MAG: primosomal protein N' (replication factor Y) [Pseudohongiellaceae bacterium]|jgi:primosomal protein N' (replication factor Y)